MARVQRRDSFGPFAKRPFADLTNIASAAAALVKPRKKEERGAKELLAETDARCLPDADRAEDTQRVSSAVARLPEDPVDQAHADDPQHVTEYVADIVAHMHGTQRATMPKGGLMAAQKEVTERMRAVLVDWLVEVHQKFKLSPETLFLAVSLLDRYLSEKPVTKAKLQLVGITCLFLAAKYEEIYPPEVREIVNVTDKEYTRSEVLEMEVTLCNTLGFKLVTCTSYAFMQRYVTVMQYGRTHTHLAQYILELALLDCTLLRHEPSFIAAAAIYLANKIMRVDEPWPARLQKHAGSTDAALRASAKEMCSHLQSANKQTLQAVRKKFSSEKLDNVVKLLA